MARSTIRNVNWIAVVSGVGLIVISAPTFASPSALAAAAAGSANQQVAEQQQPQEPYLPPGQQKPQKPAQVKPQQQQNQQQQKLQQQKQNLQQQQIKPTPNNNNQRNNQQNYNQKNNYNKNQQYNGQNNNNNNSNNNDNKNNNNKNNQQGGRYDWNSYQPGHRPPQWQQYHQNFDPRPYQWNRNAEHRYHWQPYNQPPGWHYQRWAYGQVLPSPFWVRAYWINSYYDFGLGDPPYGFVWVRYGDDALLVDVESGQILSVEYGVFY